MSVAELYDRDFYEWTLRNAELLRAGKASEADLDHIAEEIEDMGKRERRELVSRLGVLIGHLLKWQAQPDRRSRSWEATIRLQREEISDLLEEMPSLRRYLEGNLARAYRHGVIAASTETRLPIEDFLSTSPFSLDVLLDPDFMP
jgi:hypothetical protein